jgi:hypothetical protein
MPTITTESCPYLSLSQAARRIPPTKGERPCHVATLTRWITKGVRAANGSVVRLQARRFPGGWKVTAEALEEFLDKLTSAALDESDPTQAPTVRPSAQRQRVLEAIDRELDKAGICTNPKPRRPGRTKQSAALK